jgi:hypothetical protein
MGTGKWIRMTAFLILVAPTATASYVGGEAGAAAAASVASVALLVAGRLFVPAISHRGDSAG